MAVSIFLFVIAAAFLVVALVGPYRLYWQARPHAARQPSDAALAVPVAAFGVAGMFAFGGCQVWIAIDKGVWNASERYGMPPRTQPIRLLPWCGADGQPTLLVTDGAHSHLSRLADSVEATQLDTGREVLKLSRTVIRSLERPTRDELLYVTRRLAECLTDALRVADSRGLRLPG
ncbi:hypothetical protein [Streptomyces sp. JH34]|uniref:hypothetical protein n=1 Tax=Streptomyces sp. JH34 TaxID=2793633 RepID=UPI0023F8A7FE|nr:hypothetical protein [Streptomyces sp. JH34]MDF6020731.1 hypothetical protein [Streptomyces sp. JH34]